MFVCYGNICRSPMAEFIMKDFVKDKGLGDKFVIESSATSTEELGHAVHYGTQKILNRMGIDCSAKRAVRLKKDDYERYDYFIGMDEMNLRDMKRILGGDAENKIFKLPYFINSDKDVADPYWTRNFEETFTDIVYGVNGLVSWLQKNKII